MQALLAFYGRMSRVPSVKPFKSQLHQTFAHQVRPLPRGSFQDVVITMLKRDPDLGKNTEEDLGYTWRKLLSIGLALQMSVGRGIRSKEVSESCLSECGIGQFPEDDLEPFCRWLTKHGEALPAWRIFQGAQAAFTK